MSATETGVPAATRADHCVVACAEAWRNAGEILASPMGTVPAIGARLAKLTFSPELLLTDGEALLMADVPAIGSKPGAVEGWLPFRQHLTLTATGRRHVMMGASQIDRHGNQNISCIGDAPPAGRVRIDEDQAPPRYGVRVDGPGRGGGQQAFGAGVGDLDTDGFRQEPHGQPEVAAGQAAVGDRVGREFGRDQSDRTGEVGVVRTGAPLGELLHGEGARQPRTARGTAEPEAQLAVRGAGFADVFLWLHGAIVSCRNLVRPGLSTVPAEAVRSSPTA
ncbi:hypothetical protein SHIRM173S_05945 [Streptomyces hirsutus]